MLYKVVLTFESVDELLKCDHSNESYWAVLSCGTVYYAAQGGSNFWVCGWNPTVWPLKWKLLSSTFLWYCLLPFNKLIFCFTMRVYLFSLFRIHTSLQSHLHSINHCLIWSCMFSFTSGPSISRIFSFMDTSAYNSDKECEWMFFFLTDYSSKSSYHPLSGNFGILALVSRQLRAFLSLRNVWNLSPISHQHR